MQILNEKFTSILFLIRRNDEENEEINVEFQFSKDNYKRKI